MAIVSSAALVLCSLSVSLSHAPVEAAASAQAAAPTVQTASAPAVQTSSSAAVAEPRPAPADVDFRRLGDGLVYTFTKGLFARDNLPPLVIGTLGALLIHPADASLSRHLGGSAPAVGTTGGILGGPAVEAATLGGLLLVAPFTHNAKLRATTFSLFQGFALDTVLVQGLKAATGRTRPNGANDRSFPSGHASDAFLLATVLSHYYGPKVAVPAYALATLVAVARVESLEHYPSDTVAGATVGYISAMAAVRSAEHAGRRRTTVMPVVGPGRVGVMVAVAF
jgi:membrane-associated phospholipid phosphatase